LRVISFRRLREHAELPGRGDSSVPLKAWYGTAEKATWSSFDDVKRDFGVRVDLAEGKYVFDIGGNKYRLICLIDFVRHGVLVLRVCTHAEYDELNKHGGKGLKAL